ncbi:MAG: hypothetical protein IKB22_08730 [Lentisphaeria bacterium]|nr:hypothetical protein [Lentisphaeria bacterium]
MASSKQFRIRRAIIRTIYDYTCGQDLETVLCSPELLLENPAPEAAWAEWMTLIETGLLVPIPGYESRVCKLAVSLRRDMDAADGALPPHPVLFGPRVM